MKHNPKLPNYCKRFSDRFGDHAYKRSQGVMASQASKEGLAGQRAMRNACRAQLDLPHIEFKP